MRRRAARTLALAWFSAAANLRRGSTVTGIVFGLALMLAGPIIALLTGHEWSFDGSFGFFGFVVMALFTLRSGLEEQRELGLLVYLRHNFMAPVDHAAALLISLMISWLALCLMSLLAIAVIGLGDVGGAVDHVASWGTRSLLLIGLVPLVERVATFRLPFLLPVLLYLALLITLSLILPSERLLELFVSAEPGDTDALLRLAGQAALILPVSLAISFVAVVIRVDLRHYLRKIVPSRH